MSGTTTLDKTIQLEPPFADAPLDAAATAFSPPWSRFFTFNSDRIAELTQRVGIAEGDIASGGTGVTDGSDAPAGHIGEYMEATSGTLTLANGVNTNIISLSLTPGDWDVSGDVGFQSGSGTHLLYGAGLDGALDALITATFPSTTMNMALTTAVHRYSLTAATTVFLVAEAAFTGTTTAQGVIRARRAR